MTKEEFGLKLKDDNNLLEELKANPLKVLQDFEVELSDTEMEAMSGGSKKGPLKIKTGNGSDGTVQGGGSITLYESKNWKVELVW